MDNKGKERRGFKHSRTRNPLNNAVKISILLNAVKKGAPQWLSGKESTCQCRRHGFDPWSRMIPHATEEETPCATSTELRYRAWKSELLSPCAATTESPAESHALQQEKPPQ